MEIRNFSIIAHIDHGKSTLADRLLEVTSTVDKRHMKEQVLDSMELERERGITIKMTPVRMNWKGEDGKDYILNLIDTPGHIDFSYEVSRALQAVEGTLLLVDSTQGIQAQTLTTLEMARNSGLTIIPVITKIDSPIARPDDVKEEIMELLKCEESDILAVSGKTGEGVKELIKEIIKRVPEPKSEFVDAQGKETRALIFDFEYSNHMGVILYVRVLDGNIKAGDTLLFIQSKAKFIIREVGTFSPEKRETGVVQAGEIGYIVTGIKEPGIARVGDTVTTFSKPLPAFPGYAEPVPIVFASIYPESQDEFNDLRSSLSKLKLSDSSLTFEEESSGALGRGFRCGFLGMLHLEIITERLRREFDQELVVTTPSITYEVTLKNGEVEMVYTPIHFPDHGMYTSVREPWIILTIITPHDYVSPLMQLFPPHEATVSDLADWGHDRVKITLNMPLRELMRNFFNEVKSASSGYASLVYEKGEMRPADVTRLDVYVAEERVAAFSRVIPEYRAREESEEVVEKLEKILPTEMFRVKIQAYVHGKIVSSRSIAPMKKDVTGYMYGGDITRKMKLREKQKRGKDRMEREGKVHISHDTFLSMMKPGEK
ncbi:MAG: translation elongation factor 4 [Candidatus Nomurabacteria bacterium]|nr:translation elongation factor 4 [Candidatus Nomurabacteria bacterium]